MYGLLDLTVSKEWNFNMLMNKYVHMYIKFYIYSRNLIAAPFQEKRIFPIKIIYKYFEKII